MRLIHAFLVITALCGYNLAQKKMTDAKASGLVGNVRSVIEREALIRVNNGVRTEELRRFVIVTDFDKKGRKFLMREYGTGWATYYLRIHDTEVFGRQPLEELTKVDSSTLPPASSYSMPGNLDETSMPQNRYTYDKKGKILQVDRYRIDGNLMTKTSYSYDKKGRLIEWRLSGTPMGLVTTTYKYDDKKIVLESIQNNDLGTTTTEFSGYKFDDKGNWIERSEVPKSVWRDKLQQERYQKNKAPDLEKKIYRTIIYY